jgi:phosphoglycolate phosphatase
MNPQIKHIIWDWNGTLIDDAWLFVEIMNGELKDRDLPLINIEDYRTIFTFPVKKYYEILGFNFEKENFKEVGYNFIQKFKARKFDANLFPESVQILDFASKLNIHQSVVSAQEHNLLNETINHYKIDSYFESISGIEHYYADNKIKIAQAVREKINCTNNQILIIGDSSHDFDVSQALGVECVLYSGGHYSKKRLQKNNCTIIDNHSELENILI